MTLFSALFSRASVFIACSRLSVSEDDRSSKRATSKISGERDPGEKGLLVARTLFQSSALTKCGLEQATVFTYAYKERSVFKTMCKLNKALLLKPFSKAFSFIYVFSL